MVSAGISIEPSSGQAVQQVVVQHTWIISDQQFAEFEDVIRRPKLQRYISQDAVDVLRLVRVRAVVVAPTTIITNCRDPDDNHILALALDGKDDTIVTGDQDLLVLHP